MRADLSTDVRPFCAHVTLGKTKDMERLTTAQRRNLRAFGKWMQDQERPLNLQQLLNGESKVASKATSRIVASRGRKGGLDALSLGDKKRRHKSWIPAGGRGHVGRQRDLGSLNAELAAESAPLTSMPAATDSANIDVEVDSLHVMEAVRVPGAKYVEYRTLCQIPLPKGATAPAPAAVASCSDKPPSPSPSDAAHMLGARNSTYSVSSRSQVSRSERRSLTELLED